MPSKNLGELEMQVMEVVWKRGERGIKDVFEEIKKRRKIAYTTIATILQRLCDKGILVKRKDEGRSVYVPRLSKTDYSNKLIQSFFKKITHSFGDVALTSFAESIETLPKKKREHLLELLKK